jgi:addiction module RelE/StbE family toxin
MVKLVWTEVSLEDLKNIFDYIAIDSKKYASITVEKIYNNAQVIISNPFIGSVVPEFNIKFLREIISGKYRIIYKIINDSRVDILRIYHSARLLKRSSLE